MAAQDLKYSVYAIMNRETKRMYIGCTCDVQRRIGQHFDELAKHKKIRYSNVNKEPTGKEWQDDYDKYGADSFDFYVLETDISFSERMTRESCWIKTYHANDPAHGYNKACRKDDRVYEIKQGFPVLPIT